MCAREFRCLWRVEVLEPSGAEVPGDGDPPDVGAALQLRPSVCTPNPDPPLQSPARIKPYYFTALQSKL